MIFKVYFQQGDSAHVMTIANVLNYDIKDGALTVSARPKTHIFSEHTAWRVEIT